MSVAAKRLARHTVEDMLAIPEEQRFHEIIDGELVRKAMPSARHGGTQSATSQPKQAGIWNTCAARWEKKRVTLVPCDARTKVVVLALPSAGARARTKK